MRKLAILKRMATALARVAHFVFLIGLTSIGIWPQATADPTEKVIISPDMKSVSLEKSGIGVVGYFGVSDSQHPQKVTASFGESLRAHRLSGDIHSCEPVIEITVPRAGGNVSYGGVCDLTNNEQSTSVEVCNDKMVGHFKLTEISRDTATKRQLIGFVMSNCVGG